MQQINVVKIGGNVVDDEGLLQQVVKDFSQLNGHKILVHGGGKVASQIGEKLGIKARLVQGRRITDAESLQVVTMVYGGLLNKKLVALLQAAGCNALGLTGADGNLIPARKRSGSKIDYGFVGDFEADAVHLSLLQKLLAAGISPVVAPLTHDGKGNMLNTNADTIASGLAVALGSHYDTMLSYCFERSGVLTDVNNEDSLLASINFEQYQEYKLSGIIAGGMIPKLDNAFAALQSGVSRVRICHALDITNLQNGTTLWL